MKMFRHTKTVVLVVLLACLTMAVSAQDAFFHTPIPDSVFVRMRGVSFPVKGAEQQGLHREDLHYIRILYYDYEGRVQRGELVANVLIADDLVDIFKRLYEAHYPIASVRLIDDFGADDERSMRANNTSCFCYRQIAGSSRLSKHARGLAIDLNPLQNPCVRTRNGRTTVQPSTAKSYTNRTRAFKHKIDRNDLAYRLFREHGFTWGGAWKSLKDYQHFEK